MTHVVTDLCVKCKYTSCVPVCPVDCFHEHKFMVAIDPDVCIDCGVCVAECPVGAIEPASKKNLVFVERALKNVKKWPKITVQKDPLPNAACYATKQNKYETFMTQDLQAWPFIEAKRLFEHWSKNPAKDGVCRLETGYGPSGLPHLGTFCEVKRTVYVANALTYLYSIPVEIICFSDDLDPLRSIPDNVPNKSMLEENLHKPVSSVPDPFGQEKSFATNMNKRMKSFLDSFGIKYKFYSSVDCYKSGMFDEYLIKALEKYDDIMQVMLPTLGEERRKTYSPFMPICKNTGKVLQVAVIGRSLADNTISYLDPNSNTVITTKVTGGNCKLQWKPDFGMRWAALDIKYELYGKDHLANGHLYSRICSILGGKPPVQFMFELFLDSNGQKISKSKGNSISLEDLQKYFPQESIEVLIYVNPRKAKRLSFDVMITNTDRYISAYKDYHDLSEEKQKNSPLYHIHNGNVQRLYFGDITFSLLVYMASVAGTDDISIMKKRLQNFDNKLDLREGSYIEKLLLHATKYYQDIIAPTKVFVQPSIEQRESLKSILAYIDKLDVLDPIVIQEHMYSLARKYASESMQSYFSGLYQVLLGMSSGPRFGSFFSMLGKESVTTLIASKIEQSK